MTAAASTEKGPLLEDDAVFSKMGAYWPDDEGPYSDGERPSDTDKRPRPSTEKSRTRRLRRENSSGTCPWCYQLPAPSGMTVSTSAISPSPYLRTLSPTDERNIHRIRDEGPQGASTAEEGGPSRAGLTGDNFRFVDQGLPK
jgi:hypothetical protein